MAERNIDFAALARALLDRAPMLLSHWLPGGRTEGHEYIGPSKAKGGIGDSLKVNLATGAWAYFAGDPSTDVGMDLTSLYAWLHNLNNGQAARELMNELGWQQASAPAGPVRRPSGVPAPAPTPVAAATEEAGPRKSMWRAVVPVPDHAPPAEVKHWHYQAPDFTWSYTFNGALYGYVVRFKTSTGGKEVLPLTWCVDEGDDRGTQRWHWKQWEEPRPLYVPAGSLSADARPVVLVEGKDG
jgi:hypothetical protein